MTKSLFVPAIVLFGALMTMSGCAADDTTNPGDDQAPAMGESELTATKFTRLDIASKEDVADELSSLFSRQLDECLAAHTDIQMITKNNLDGLTQVGSTSYFDLEEAIEMMLVAKGQQSAKPSTLKSYARTWALATLAPFTQADGSVKFEGINPTLVYHAVRSAEERLSLERAENPRGANIKTLREQWSQVENARWQLDSGFLRPVKADREPNLTEMKKALGIPRQASLVSWGYQAIDDMAAAGEGPDGHASFTPIKNTLKYGIGIKKRFYFAGGGENWSTNVLVVMDEKNQLWGFSMGYSE